MEKVAALLVLGLVYACIAEEISDYNNNCYACFFAGNGNYCEYDGRCITADDTCTYGDQYIAFLYCPIDLECGSLRIDNSYLDMDDKPEYWIVSFEV